MWVYLSPLTQVQLSQMYPSASACPQGRDVEIRCTRRTCKCVAVPGGPGESLLVQGQFYEGNGGELLTELLKDDESSQEGQVLQSEDAGKHK